MKNMFIIASKEISQDVRDLKTLVLIVIMPTILTFVLGIAFTDNMNNDINLNGVGICYIYRCTDIEKQVFNNFVSIVDKMNTNTYEDDRFSDQANINIVVNSLDNIEITYQNGYENEIKIVRGLLLSFLDRSTSIKISNKMDYDENDSSRSSMLKVTSIRKNGTANSLDYYGVTMVTLTIMFFSVSSAYKIISEKRQKTINRIMYTSVSKLSIIFGKIIGSIAVALLQILIVLLVSSKFLNVFWGSNLISVIIILLSLSLVSVSLGILMGFIFSDTRVVWIILLSVIMILGLMAGSYIPVEYLNISDISKLNIINPLAITNKTIFSIIYSFKMKQIINCVFINFVYSIVFIGVSLRWEH